MQKKGHAMHYRIANLLILVFFIFATESSFASPPSRQSLEELIEASGLDADLKILEQSIVTSAVEAALKNRPKDETVKGLIDILLADNLRETFQYSLLLDEVTYFLKKRVSEEDVQESLVWYRSELGQRIVQIQAAASSKEGSAAMQSEKNQLLNQHDLITMASEVDEAIGISNAMVDLQINTQKAMILASLAILAPDKDMTELEHANWSDIKTADRAALQQPLAQHYQVTFAYSMKAFSQAEREQYKDFLMTPSSIKIINATLTGISKAVEIGAHNFIAELEKDLKNPSPKLQQLLDKKPTTNAAQNTTSTTGQNPTSTTNVETTSENSDW
jgi:hypothetical protein